MTALAKIGVDELADSDENLAGIVSQALGEAFAAVEDLALAGGSGTDQPWAITHNVTQKVTAATADVITPDDLKKLAFRVPARFRKRGVYVVHSKVEEAVALLKDLDGRYLLQQSAALGEPRTLFGYPFHVSDGLAAPDATATATDKAAVFGDFKAGYMVADRQRFTVQRLVELYASEGKVGLLCKLRVGGDVIRPSALAYYEV